MYRKINYKQERVRIENRVGLPTIYGRDEPLSGCCTTKYGNVWKVSNQLIRLIKSIYKVIRNYTVSKSGYSDYVNYLCFLHFV